MLTDEPDQPSNHLDYALEKGRDKVAEDHFNGLKSNLTLIIFEPMLPPHDVNRKVLHTEMGIAYDSSKDHIPAENIMANIIVNTKFTSFSVEQRKSYWKKILKAVRIYSDHKYSNSI